MEFHNNNGILTILSLFFSHLNNKCKNCDVIFFLSEIALYYFTGSLDRRMGHDVADGDSVAPSIGGPPCGGERGGLRREVHSVGEW